MSHLHNSERELAYDYDPRDRSDRVDLQQCSQCGNDFVSEHAGLCHDCFVKLHAEWKAERDREEEI